MDSKELATTIANYLSFKKAEDVVIIDVKEKTVLCDYFVIASGRSSTQVSSLAEVLDEELSKKYDVNPRRAEGIREGRWAVMDYTDVIVHIFNDESRLFYHLERLWEDAGNVTKID